MTKLYEFKTLLHKRIYLRRKKNTAIVSPTLDKVRVHFVISHRIVPANKMM